MRYLLLFLVLGASLAPDALTERVKELEVSENVRPGTRVGFIDVDNPPYLIVSMSGPSVDTDLIVDNLTGEIKTRVPLDREIRSSYMLVALPQNLRVIVNVLDENDNAPTFPVGNVDLEFPESAPGSTKRALPPAQDPDVGQYSTQRYEIISGNHNGVFKLVQHRGRDDVLYVDLQNEKLVDRENRAQYRLVIEALDGGAPPLRSRLHVNVTVQDINDNSPVFNQSRYYASVPENATVGTPVLAVNATDADAGDNGRIEYSISRRQSDREEMFRIDPETGMVYVNKALDYEAKMQHELVIFAQDFGAQRQTSSTFMSVSVIDVNDNQPAITVIFLSDDKTPKISESAQPGEFIARISVSDPDSRTEYSNATVTLTGGEGHFGLATRDNIIYLVVVERPLDREEKPEYDLSVEATDAGTPPLRAVRTFRLLVTDVNDNAPKFDSERYEAHLFETSEPGTSVLRVNATDLDEGANSAIRYSLQNSTWFAINETTGLVTTVTHVDCEANPTPTFVVVATDSGYPPLSSSATVLVTVHDVNDNEPIFEKPLYNATIPEDMSVGSCFLKVQASDPDCGVNAMVNYTLAGGRPESKQLLVRSDTGHICVRSRLDRETAPYLELPVIATDRGGLSTTAIVRVEVTDVNDNRPIFEPQRYNVTLRSDSTVHGPILKLSATDLDAGVFGQFTYRITSGNEGSIFRVDRNTGELHVARPSQLSRSSLHQFNVSAMDAVGLKSIVDAEVKVTVSSAGRRIATCEKPRYTITVKENVPQNTVIGGVKDTATASSSSTGERSSRFYLVREEADLSLDPNTGTLRIRQPLDRESRDKYVLSVEARNAGSVGYCQVEVIVEDVNDNAPSFSTTSARISVPESHPLHVPLYVAHATDPDVTPSLPIRYLLSQNSNDLFGIDARTGELYLVRRLDYETQSRHSLLITALDGAGLSANLSLSVEVQDVNDNPPAFERNEYHVEVPEGAGLDSQIFQVTAVDQDTGNNARLSYRLQGSAAFRISPNTGWIYLAQTLDRETLDRYALTVLATDNGSPAATASASVLVTVLDDNDNDPRFEKDFYGFELLENLPSGTAVGSVSATDSDLGKNSLLRYAVVQANSSFTVDPDTGEITTREPLDRETKAVHELVLEARDQGTPSRAARVPLKVTVLDVNDNSPEIVDPQGNTVSVREEQPPGTEIARVRALDTDFGENASVTYSILKERTDFTLDRDSDGYNVFTIDPITGMIRTKTVLDHEERNVYRVSIKAADAGHPPRHSVRALRVEVLALADNRPTFTSSSLAFNVREDASIGRAIGSVSGAGPAGRMAFTLNSLMPISEFPAFDVDRSSGQLVVAHSLDRENVSEYHLKIRALDTTSIGNPQSIAVSVKIVIEDANDNAPSWPQDPIIVRVSEGAAIGSTIYNLTASDLDSGLNGELRYDLVAEFPSKGYFAVDSLTGALTLAKQLDREERTEYTLILKASDRAPPGEQLASTVTAQIIVLDQNDNDPVFIAPESTKITIASNLPPGTSLVRVVAVDKDFGDNGRVFYVITAGNQEARFSVGFESGVVSLTKPITTPVELEITANDRGSPPRKARLKLNLIPVPAQTIGPPRLLLPNPVVTISENLHVGTPVINVAAPAIADQGNVTFSIVSDTASKKFTVMPSGLVVLQDSLDREEVAHYVVSIVARSPKLLDITTLEVIVMDENDNTPEFRPGSCYTLAVPENQEEYAIHTIAATDLDEGKNGEISYSIVEGNIDAKFELDQVTGVLSMSNLDCESVSKYVLTISAKDNGRSSREARCNLTVIVLDINDNAPSFVFNQYTESYSRNIFSFSSPSHPTKYATTISEDIAPDSSVMSVKATDPDQGVNGKITYAIAKETSWLFRVDNLTGVVTTAGPLDRERESSYTFLIVATDSGKYDAKSTSIPVEINISDVNDNAPVFEEYPFRARVSIGTQPGQSILRVSANDADDGLNGEILYSFLHEQEKPKFRIHPSTGEVTASLSLSQDNGKTYHLEVLAKDKGNPPRSAKGLIELQIGDHADLPLALKFQNDTYSVVVPENSAAGTEIVQIIAVRTDGRRQHVSYSIASGNDFDTFAIDEGTGLLRVNNPTKLDAELWNDLTNKPSDELSDDAGRTTSWARSLEGQPKEEPRESSRHILNVLARTAGSDALEAYVKVIVRVSDVNDNPPIFTQTQYSATVLEGNVKGDFVVQLSASDADQGLNSRILYHIVDGNPDNAFTISPPYSGIVRTNIVLDREIREKYRLTVIATDQGNPQLTGTAALSVRVIDINDNQPTFPQHNVISVSEGTVMGTVLTTITANDVDSSPALTYRFGNVTNPGPFSIDRYSGKIVLRKRLDAETRSEYTLQVIASDGMHEATTDLTIRVTDINDNAPQFLQTVYVAVLSEGLGVLQEILTVNATDDDLSEDNSKVNYYLQTPVKGFLINSQTGTVTVNRTAIPRPMPREMNLAIVAKDHGTPPAFSVCSIIVRLSNLKSALPGREYNVTVKEGSPKGTTLMRLSDVDLLDGAIVAGDDSGAFEISRGKLMLSKILDREIKDKYVLSLGSKIGNVTTGSLVGDEPVTVTIIVEDINDNYPYFVKDPYEVLIKEDAPRGTIVAVLHAKDDDMVGSAAATLVYDITSGNDGDLFRVEKTTGAVLVNSTLDCDLEPEVYNLVVMACDSDPVSPLCALARLRVVLEDVNDNSPKFPVSEYLEFVSENEPIGTTIFSARASDLDRGIFGSLNYSIVSAAASGFSDIDDSWRLFAVDERTGTVTTRAQFDYEHRNRYAFTLHATDMGGRTAAVRVRVEIESKDEFFPQFTEKMYRFGIRSKAQILPGTVIGHVTATDRDKGPDGRVVYQLRTQNPYFKLNRTTGALIVKQKLMHIELDIEDSSRLMITASSGRQGSLSNMTIVEITLMDDTKEPNEARGALTTPTNVDSNMAVATSGGLADWVLGLLIALLLLILAFGAIFLYLHIRNRRHKKPGTKPGLNGEGNATASNSYVDPSAFDTIPIRSVTGVGANGNSSSGSAGGAGGGASCQFAPPKYDEIPPYGTSGQSGQQQATSELSGSDQSGSSGRGSAEDDGDDEEIRMINEGQQTGDSASDLSVHNTQEYLARLGIVDPPAGTPRRPPEALPLDSLHLFEDEASTEADIATLIYGKIGEPGRPTSGLEVPGGPSMNGSLSSIVHSEEELTGSYNWDYLLDWGPQYQPLAHVFSEIARLKDDAASVQSGNSGSSGKTKSVHKAPPPPLLTSVAPRSLAAPALARGILPRSPISHDASTFPSAALSPSFSPSLSPLATRSPSISPLVPPTTQRSGQSATRGIPVTDAELRI